MNPYQAPQEDGTPTGFNETLEEWFWGLITLFVFVPLPFWLWCFARLLYELAYRIYHFQNHSDPQIGYHILGYIVLGISGLVYFCSAYVLTLYIVLLFFWFLDSL